MFRGVGGQLRRLEERVRCLLAASEASKEVGAHRVKEVVVAQRTPFSPEAKHTLSSANRFGMGEPGTEHMLIVIVAAACTAVVD